MTLVCLCVCVCGVGVGGQCQSLGRQVCHQISALHAIVTVPLVTSGTSFFAKCVYAPPPHTHTLRPGIGTIHYKFQGYNMYITSCIVMRSNGMTPGGEGVISNVTHW